MADQNQLFIAYCQSNQDVAEGIQQQLGQAGFQFELLSDKNLGDTDCLSNVISNSQKQGLLVISDNFLKSKPCMKEMLLFIEVPDWEKKVQVVITDGRYPEEDGDAFQTIKTTYDRVSDVIRYMNFWQEDYLEMRKIKRTLSPEQEEPFNKKLQLVKSISNQIGDFLRILRTKTSWDYEMMTANDFALFFKKFGTPVQHESFKQAIKKTTTKTIEPVDSFELEQDLSQLPGIDLLTQAEKKGIPPVIEEKIAQVDPLPKPVLAEEKEIVSDTKKLAKHSISNVVDPLEDLVDEKGPDDEPLDIQSEFSDSYQELQAVYVDDKEEEEEDIIEDITEDFDLQLESEGVEITNVDPPVSDFIPPDNFSDEEGLQNEDPEQALHKASNLIEAGEIEQAINLLDEIVDEHPDNSNARFLLAGIMLTFRKDTQKAQNQLLKVVELDPENSEAFHHLGKIAESGHDFIAAKKYYEKVVKLAPDTKDIYYKLGLITSGFFKDEYKRASKYFKRAIQEDRKNTDAWYRLGILHNEHFDKPRKALNYFKRALKLQPDHPFANYDLALLYHSIGDSRNAATYYHKACQANPEIKTGDNDQVFRLDKFSKPGSSVHQDPDSTKKKTKAVKIPKFVKKLSKAAKAERIGVLTEEQPKTEPGKIVFITGATAGIGRATAQKFAENGYRLILNGRRIERLVDLQNTFEEQYQTQHKILPFDVRNIEQVQEAIHELDEEWRQVDILINNAGLAKGYAPIHEGELKHWETMIDTNVKGLLYLTRAIAPHMVKRRSGHIINVCSSAGHEVYPNGNVYCATKFAVDALTKSMRIDLYKYNIRVGQVSPGHVEETEFAFVRFEDHKKAKIYEDFQPLNSSDIAEAIFFMATAPPHVNIQDIQLMGTQQASNNYIDRSGR